MNELMSLVLFYFLLFSGVVIIIGLMKIHECEIRIKNNNLWIEYYGKKLIFINGWRAGIRR